MSTKWKYGVIVNSFGSFPGPCVLLLVDPNDYIDDNPRWLFPADDPSTDSALSYGYNRFTVKEIRENWDTSLERIVLNSNPDYYWRTTLEEAEKMNIILLGAGQENKAPKPLAKEPVKGVAPQSTVNEPPPGITPSSTSQSTAIGSEGAFSFQVSATFMIKGKGLVAVGHVISGTITPGEIVEVEVLTGTMKAKVVELGMFAKQLKKASAGEEVGLTLEGIGSPISTDQVKAGMIIYSGS